ncbi:bifunctional 2-C-methyl-D-erythritol 4-phosphate cytidylyltransferase/2-C-methyl-D-erythritol 2,4-cyclodiphosphate synthase [Helicobacter sp. MIT 05-5293]|uniref:bifunctional 2-C-methyl-D-erythritol 4-phosphate cytidylyltransferase/2-C-methyl-D-erythritol 2,4-cyclodiphosphate synthase n=1 Tax=Helicobacter sp. MIT 05-5293 TaxID=1548149 RepID=UPI0009E051D4|nr:bifunctional 2-C-methyl-D-erythritol 4-phosphate cytidylyltransferase/2-C-methyl-D-erythritol 2,4-cyclodiphosphate synthase [Helicobacter sp. MIT 05-5293]TLD80559.1 bifunctional 2-C-methyl-D-erythritol 4-phosphate cytidylyltransferase/2-C-methyl-D-erythritol 2,4-cyclodiphosphate synthase [Helicobacter sp. MIT 05-5293]
MTLDDVSLVMMAAGNSTRFCEAYPVKKQWLRIGDDPLWLFATRKLATALPFKNTFITASPEDFSYMQKISEYPIIKGGQTRCQSLKNALQHIQTPFVLVSDVARWDTDIAVVKTMLESIDDDVSCVVPYMKVADTTFYEGSYLQRESLKLIQTPQLSRVKDLRESLSVDKDFSDESSALHHLGKKIVFVQGNERMNKLTHRTDIWQHQKRLNPPCAKIFVGNGIDIHAFEEGKIMKLGGVKIDSPLGFKAHSDGDVALHALSDAILGAIGAGDIGEWFPDTDDANRNADSKKMLQKIYNFAQSVGYEIINTDITILAQTPKITPYKIMMQECIAKTLGIKKSCVNIKATTTENLGFIGRKEGVCVQANVSMRYIDWRFQE